MEKVQTRLPERTQDDELDLLVDERGEAERIAIIEEDYAEGEQYRREAEEEAAAELAAGPPFVQCCIAEDGYEACGLPRGHKGHHVWSGDYLCGRESTIWPGEYCGRPAGHDSVCAVLSPPDDGRGQRTPLEYWWEAPTKTREDGR